MKQSIDQIRKEFCKKIHENCFVQGNLGRDGCNLKLTDISTKRFIVDFDHDEFPLLGNNTRCDFLLIADSGKDFIWVVPIELKKGNIRFNKILSQLRASTLIAEQNISSNISAKFRPVAAARKMSKIELRNSRILNNLIKFHNQEKPIKFVKCDDKLTNALR